MFKSNNVQVKPCLSVIQSANQAIVGKLVLIPGPEKCLEKGVYGSRQEKLQPFFWEKENHANYVTCFFSFYLKVFLHFRQIN